jgi:hypothetical protein
VNIDGDLFFARPLFVFYVEKKNSHSLLAALLLLLCSETATLF